MWIAHNHFLFALAWHFLVFKMKLTQISATIKVLLVKKCSGPRKIAISGSFSSKK
jgi:hypothetical protein